jgi:ribosomal-protein-alanine N-acetyltransferase
VIGLKPVELADAPVIFEAWGRHPENFQYLTARVFASVADARAYIGDLFPTPESLAFHIVTSSGVVGIVKASVVGHRAQVGYVVHELFAGRGIATAAVRELVTRLEAVPKISRIWATCALDNVASARVLEKSGFVREAVLKNWVIYPAQSDRAFDNYSYVRIPGAAGQGH